ncbi:MAG: hypothetical protein HRU09_02440 [Oligoflexales bacterium]|nr:hypothetical protein [Oligoflexales bacterium]
MTEKKNLRFKLEQSLLRLNEKVVDQDFLQSSFFILPRNDGEAKRACDILLGLKAPHVHISSQSWGATLDKEWSRLSWHDLANIKRVVIFEMPGQRISGNEIQLESQIKQMGLELKIIDHHYYRWVDRYHQKSALEQLCECIGWPLDWTDHAIAVNDRSYIPGLKQLGLSHDEIVQVRVYDLKAQGFKPDYIAQQMEKAPEVIEQLRPQKRGELWVLRNAPIERIFILQELALQSPTGLSHVLEIGPRKLSFSGSPKVVKRLLKLDYTKFGFAKGYTCYGGGDEGFSKFWGFRPRRPHEGIDKRFVEEMLMQIGNEIKVN